VRYLSRTGHDTRAMARFLSKLRAHSRLEAQLRGEPPDKVDQFDYLATHPAPVERVDRATQLASAAGAQRDPIVGRDIYLSQIDGLMHGDDPAQGYIRGRVFAHPALRLRFEVPPGFRLFNSPTTVAAFGPEGSRIMFDRARNPTAGPIRSYLTDVWAKGATLSQIETIDVNGLEGATGAARGRTDAGAIDLRLVAIRVDARTIYRFLFVTPTAMTPRIATELRRTTYSFRRLSDAEVAQLKPLRLRIRTVGPGDTVDSLASRMPFEDFRRERFEVMNGLSSRAQLSPGMRVKIITE
jgi:predicted Zn-dependent protease